jgi:cyanophycin synthetase
MGVKADNIKHGLRTFDASFFQAPGRTNVWDKLPFKVILDYGHNPAAVQALVSLSKKLDTAGERAVVLAAPGDRRDEDILAIAKAAAGGGFDHYIVRRDDDPRGRKPDEVPRMLREGLVASGVPESKITVIPDEVQAIDHALRLCRRGDLLLVFGDKPSRCWKQIIYFKPEGHEAAPLSGVRVEKSPPRPAPEQHEARDLPSAFGPGQLIQDERGVRLVKGTED